MISIHCGNYVVGTGRYRTISLPTLLLLLLLLLLPADHWAQSSLPLRPSVAASRWVGYREQGYNRGRWIDSFNIHAGVPLGSPYCASFVYWILDSLRWEPRLRTGYSRSYVRYGIPISLARERGAEGLLIWRRRGGGHIGFVVRNSGAFRWETVEANTSPGRGSQWNGDGIYRRIRSYDPLSVFRITHYVPLREVSKRH